MINSINQIDEQNNEKTFLEGFIYYLAILLKYKWFLIIVTGLVAIFITAFCLISVQLPPESSPLPDYYVADAVLILNDKSSDMSQALYESMNIQIPSSLEFTDYGGIALRYLNSRSFLDKIVHELDFAKHKKINPNHRLKLRQVVLDQTEFSYNYNQKTLSIKFTDIEPAFAKDVVTKMVDLLNEWFPIQGGNSRINQQKLLTKKLEEIKVKVTLLENEIKEFQKKYGILKPDDITNLQNDMLKDLRAQLVVKELEIKKNSQFYSPDDPTYKRLQFEKKNILDLIKQVENGYTSSGYFIAPKEDIPELTQEYNNLNIALETQKKIFDTLSQQYEIIKLDVKAEQMFSILEWPEVPEAKAGPFRTNIILSTMGGTFLGCIVLIFLFHFFKTYKILERLKKAD